MLVFALSNFVLCLHGVFMEFGLGLCCLWLLRWGLVCFGSLCVVFIYLLVMLVVCV